MTGVRKTPAGKAALKQQQALDGATALAEYQAARAAEREKTARLRALRLAKKSNPTATKKPKPQREG